MRTIEDNRNFWERFHRGNQDPLVDKLIVLPLYCGSQGLGGFKVEGASMAHGGV